MKTNNTLCSEKGFSLTEILVAGGIFALILGGAMGGFKYFKTQTTSEFKKIGDIAEFNQLTRDLMRFTEGAGISTSYLNLPLEVHGCKLDENNKPTRPCVMKSVDGNLVLPEEGDLPAQMRRKCVQFFKDGRGNLKTRRAFPGKANNDLLMIVDDVQLKTKDIELLTVWPLVDEKSAPFPMMKLHPGGVYLSMLKGPAEIGRSKNQGSDAIKYAFFEFMADESDPAKGSPDVKSMTENIGKVLSLKGNPFLIYNSSYTNQYTVQWASEIVDCYNNTNQCKKILRQIQVPKTYAGPNVPEPDNTTLGLNLATNFPNNVFMIEMKPIDQLAPSFQDIANNQELPSECKSNWGTKQSELEYFFPSKGFSVFSAGNAPTDDLGGAEALNVLHLSHYYTSIAVMPPDIKKGVMVAVPIDLATYKVRNNGEVKGKKQLSLVLSKWHDGQMAESDAVVRIPNLKAPFLLTRKVGTAEMGMMYNPMETKQDAPGGKK